VPSGYEKLGIDVTAPNEERLQARSDLAWAIAIGGIGAVSFAALLTFTWYFATTLFLIFTGMLMAVALNAMTNRLGWLIRLPHALRLAIVCVALAALFSSVLFLGGTTMAQQAAALSDTIKSQLVNVKAFLDSHGIDTSYFELGSGSVNQGAPSGGTPAGELLRRIYRVPARLPPVAASSSARPSNCCWARSARSATCLSWCFSASPLQHNPPCTAADCCSSHPQRSAPAPPSSSTASARRWSAG